MLPNVIETVACRFDQDTADQLKALINMTELRLLIRGTDPEWEEELDNPHEFNYEEHDALADLAKNGLFKLETFSLTLSKKFINKTAFSDVAVTVAQELRSLRCLRLPLPLVMACMDCDETSMHMRQLAGLYDDFACVPYDMVSWSALACDLYRFSRIPVHFLPAGTPIEPKHMVCCDDEGFEEQRGEYWMHIIVPDGVRQTACDVLDLGAFGMSAPESSCRG